MIRRVVLAGLVGGGAAPAAPGLPDSDIAILIAVLVGFAVSIGFVVIVAKVQAWQTKSGTPHPAMAKLVLKLKEWGRRAAQYLAILKARREQAARQAKLARPVKLTPPPKPAGPSRAARAMVAIDAWWEQHKARNQELADLRDEIGNWPKVVKIGTGYVLTATHDSPRYADSAGKASKWTAVAVFVACLAKGQHGFADGLIFGAIAGFGGYPFWKQFYQVRLTITVEDGGASWTGPGGIRCRIRPGEDYERISRPHHKGPEAAWVHQENVRRGKIKPGQKVKQTYEVSSEVLFRSGRHRQHVWPVAEIMPDVSVNSAGGLAAALDLAIEKSRADVEQAKAAARGYAGMRGGAAGRNLDDE